MGNTNDYYSALEKKFHSLKEIQQNLETIFNSTYDAIIIHDLNGNILDVNERMLTMYNLSKSQALKLNIKDLSNPNVNPQQLDYYTSRSVEGDFTVFEWSSIKFPDNTPFPVSVALCNIIWNGQQATLATIREITKIKEASEILMEEEKKYRLIFENMNQSFALHEIIFDHKGIPCDYRYLAANPAYEKLTGIPISNIIGKTMKELQSEIDPYWFYIYSKVAITGESISLENYNDKLGRHLEIRIFSPQKNQFAVISSDITEKIHQEKALKNALIELESTNITLESKVHQRTKQFEDLNLELKEKIIQLELAQAALIRTEKLASLVELVSGVAHEINTPIGVGVTAASYLMSSIKECQNSYYNKNMQPEMSKYINKWIETSKIILSNLERTANLVKDFKQVSVDQTSEVLRTINLKEYIDTIIASLMPKIRKTNHCIRNLCDENIEICIYPGVISQITTNLILNSLLHAFEDKYEGIITITAALKNEEIEMTFSDNGIGIDKSILPKIYDPFFTTKRNFGGTGLGLFIVHNLVTNQLGGSIECKSRCKKGTSFKICIPV